MRRPAMRNRKPSVVVEDDPYLQPRRESREVPAPATTFADRQVIETLLAEVERAFLWAERDDIDREVERVRRGSEGDEVTV